MAKKKRPAERKQRRATGGSGALTVRAVGLTIAILFLYRLVWTDTAAFVSSLDHGRLLFGDFATHYYRAGRAIFATKLPAFGYYYSPTFAMLVGAFSLFALPTALWMWGAVQVGAIVALLVAPMRALRRFGDGDFLLYLVLVLTSVPVLHNVRWGQVSVLVTAGVVASVLASRGGRETLGGALLAGVVTIKYYPVVFLVCLLAVGRRRALVAFALAAWLLLVLIPAAVLGPRACVDYYRAAFAGLSAPAMQAFVAGNVNSQYLGHVTTRLMGTGVGVAASIGVGMFAIHLLLCAYVLLRRGRAAMLWSAVLLFLSLPLVVRTCWPHYLSYLPFCQVLTLRAALDMVAVRPRLGAITLAAVSILLSSIVVFLAIHDWMVYQRWGLLLWSDLLLLPLVYWQLVRELREGARTEASTAGGGPPQSASSIGPAAKRPFPTMGYTPMRS